MLPPDIRDRTMRALVRVIDDPGASPADIARAGQALAALDVMKGAGGDIIELTDAQLEAIARGEGGAPPERGPATGVTATGPIHADEDPLADWRSPIPTEPRAGTEKDGNGGTHFAGPSLGGPANSPASPAKIRRRRK